MKGFYAHLQYANDIQPDDWFRMCGFVCRVVDVETGGGKTTIGFYVLAEYPGGRIPVPPTIVNHLTMSSNVPLKIYNQK